MLIVLGIIFYILIVYIILRALFLINDKEKQYKKNKEKKNER
jgi:hypothetical protein